MSAFHTFQRPYVLDDGAAANYGKKISFNLRDRNWWLTHLDIIATVRLSAAVVTPTADSVANLVKNVSLEVNEQEMGTRLVVNAAGPALTELSRQWYGFTDSLTHYSYQRLGASGNIIGCVYSLPFQNPLVPMPNSYAMALPLMRYGSDPVLTVELAGASTDMGATFAHATAGTLGVRVEAIATYAEVIDPEGKFPHWRQELVTSHAGHIWGGTGQRAIDDLTQGNLLLGMLQQDYLSTGARGYAVQADGTDAAMAASLQSYSLEYRGRTLRQLTPLQAIALNSQSIQSMPGGSSFSPYLYNPTAGQYQPNASIYWDFLTDRTMTDAYSLRSGLDLSPLALNGGKLRLIASSIGHASNRSRITMWKLVGDPRRFATVAL